MDMDVPVLPDPPEPAPTDAPPFGKSIRSKTIPMDLETVGSSGRSNGRSSVDSTSDRQAGEAESSKSGSSGLSKLLASRKKRKKRKDDLRLVDKLAATVESKSIDEALPSSFDNPRPRASSTSLLPVELNSLQSDPSNLLTDDSEPDRTPPLTSHDSHSGFYTASSPLIKAASADGNDTDGARGDAESAISGSTPERRSSNPDTELLRPATQPVSSNLSVPTDRNYKKKSVSKAQRLKNAFSSDKKIANRERAESMSGGSSRSASRRSSLSSKMTSGTLAEAPPPIPSIPKPLRMDLKEGTFRSSPESPRLQTPPHSAIPFPSTTVTPPTPHLENAPLVASFGITESPSSIASRDLPPGVVVSSSGNMISHRRVRSTSSVNPKPSKLSNSIAASPTIEEGKPGTSQTGFFSSVFSAAQSAASTLTSTLNAQKVRSPIPAANGSENQPPNEIAQESDGTGKAPLEEKKPMAVDTLGSGDLNFSHLDIDIPPGGFISTPDGVVIPKPDLGPETRRSPAVSQRDEAAAELEDRRVARAVTMAYEKADNVLADDGSDVQTSTKEPTGAQTPSGGSAFDGEVGTRPFRSSSVRSRLARRRHRGSSGATSSTIGAIGAGAIALGVPGANASLPRLTGFAVASKKRNRDFHQLFRSVPEDDYLIEDYSCALQREIILAGRIYISEGHICFSSNILGWVTTLVISFDEVVAIEKESTAMVFPNAIAIQTLHARHTFRSLLSRESTYDLMVNIWKINHPSLKSSVNGTRVTDSTGDKTEKAGESDDESEDEEDEIYDEDEDEDNAESFFDAGDDSIHESDESLPAKGPPRQASGTMSTLPSGAGPNGTSKAAKGTNGDADNDFPGPLTHPPSQYDGPEGQYDRVIKDETIPAPLGMVYSYVFGPASVSFIPKFLVENQKSGELEFNCGKTGLTNENRTRKYSYIKPLNGSIGPKQTKCISTEQLDFLDLEKAVLVTLSTQTPDVPSGNVFTTKTKYLFTWAANNQTRFLMTCTIEWSGKSWLKGPIEKGAIDGQGTFGADLIAALKTAVAPRGRVAGGKIGAKGKGRRKKGDAVNEEAAAADTRSVADASAKKVESWGFFEPLHGMLSPVAGILQPLWNGNVAVLVIGALLFMLFFRQPPNPPSILSADMGYGGHSIPQRLAAYEEMWRTEESELWHWLEDRVGLDGIAVPTVNRQSETHTPRSNRRSQIERELKASLSEETLSDREMDHAIRTTRERLDTLERILHKRRSQSTKSTESTREEL
ncbi:hypothetical protein BDW66DRAFT_71036 [Aspergillus desertorum]